MKAIIDAKDLKELVDKTKRFVGDNYNNKMMRYIHIVVNADEQEVRAEAVDGHRFSVAYCRLKDGNESFECFITPDIPKITKSDMYAEIEINEDKAFVTVGDSIRGYRQPEGEFYDLSSMTKTDKEPAIQIGFDTKLLAEALQSVKDKKSTHNVARLYFYNPAAPVLIRSNEKDIAGVLPVRISSEEWEGDAKKQTDGN